MKKILLTLSILSIISISATAQINVGLGATYTSYGGEISKATPGVALRGAYNITEKQGLAAGFSYNFPMKKTYTENGLTVDQTISFMAANVFGILHLIGTYEDNFSLYFPVGGSYVMGKAKYTATGTNAGSFAAEDEKVSGLTLNAGVGAQFKIGNPFIFAEAGFALPAGTSSTNSRTGSTENPNPIASHSIITVGVRFPFGSSY